jgi:hypothetical protein
MKEQFTCWMIFETVINAAMTLVCMICAPSLDGTYMERWLFFARFRQTRGLHHALYDELTDHASQLRADSPRQPVVKTGPDAGVRYFVLTSACVSVRRRSSPSSGCRSVTHAPRELLVT